MEVGVGDGREGGIGGSGRGVYRVPKPAGDGAREDGEDGGSVMRDREGERCWYI